MNAIYNEKLVILKSLLNSKNSHYPLLKSIISNKKKGKAYVDCRRKPSFAGVLSSDNWFYLLGENVSNDFRFSLDEMLVNKIIKEKVSIFWFGIPDNWKIKFLQDNLVVVKDYPRNQYKFNKHVYKSYVQNYQEYQLEPISSRNVDKLFRYSNGELHNFWQTKESLLENGFGFILLDNERIIAHSLSASIEDCEVEIDIGTRKEYRGKGIAKYLTSCLIDKCLQKLLEPKWDCGVWNIPSNRLAIKLGFKKVKEYPFSIIHKK